MSYWYLASVYTKYLDGHEAAFDKVCRFAALLSDAGVDVFSPIAHGHPIAKYTKVSNTDWMYWIEKDRPFMNAACGLIVYQMQGWEVSDGVSYEISYFKHELGRPIVNFPDDDLMNVSLNFAALRSMS